MDPIELHSGPAEHRVQNLLRLLDVEPVDERTFEGRRKQGGRGRIYGGEAVAQALVAAIKTVPEGRCVHSLHGYFLRGGSEDHRSSYDVSADFDGRSFSNRRVVATQRDEVILNLAASFHKPESGRHHQAPMPSVPPPEDLPDMLEMAEGYLDGPLSFIKRPWPLEWRISLQMISPEAVDETGITFWFRAAASIDAPQWMHRAVLAYASDLGPMSAASYPHGRPGQGASIDHSIWFHDDVRADEWLLYYLASPWARHARGLGIGNIYDRTGRLVATVAQEGLMRFGAENDAPSARADQTLSA